jgi:hypothetical protein
MAVTEDALYDIIQSTWNSTLGFEVNRAGSNIRQSDAEVAARASVSGAWNGEVCLRCPQPLARLIAGAFFQIEAQKASDDQISDALSELIHIVGGNLKALLPQPITLSLPSSGDPADGAPPNTRAKAICQLSLKTSGYPFAVSLFGGVAKDRVDPMPGGEESPFHTDRQ